MIRTGFRLWLGILTSLCSAALLVVSAQAETFHDRIDSGGRERSFIVTVPEDARPGETFPTIFALHGALMTGKSMRRIIGFDELAAEGRFVVVYPNGVRRRWNDGRRMHRGRPNDVQFMRDLAEHLIKEGLADPNRLYLMGVSNGGMLTFRVACESPGVFAAYGAVIANMPATLVDRCDQRGIAPMLIINATKDPLVPWEGGEIGRWRNRGEVLSTQETVDFWRGYNGCSGSAQMKALPDKDRTDGSTVVAKQYTDCGSRAPVVLLSVEGGGHLPPGADIGGRPLLESMLGGPANQDISAAEVSWRFFRRFPL